MKDEASPSAAPHSLEIDLALSFQPAWVKEGHTPDKTAKLAEHYEKSEGRERGGKRRGEHGASHPGRRSERRPGPGRSGGRGASSRRDGNRAGRREAERPARQEPPLEGWEVQFFPEPRGVEGLARQIKASAITYPVFDLAHLVLEKPDRYRIRLERKSGPVLFQLNSDGSLWLSEREAIRHAVTGQVEKFYRRESVTVDPPKGSYSCVAQCGMSETLLGPPNHHDYQDKLRKLHAARFSQLSFEVYKSRVRMLRDEEAIQKWKDEQSRRDEYFPLEVPEGSEPVKLITPTELEQHFKKHHASTAIQAVTERCELPGSALIQASAFPAKRLARQTLDELRRFPLPLVHTLGRGLASQGLQIFKAHKNITYVSVARPRFLDRVATPVSENLSAIFSYVEAHPGISRAECRKSLAESQAGAGDAAENTVGRDLSWLLHQGYIMDYARKGLELASRGKGREERGGKRLKQATGPMATLTLAQIGSWSECWAGWDIAG